MHLILDRLYKIIKILIRGRMPSLIINLGLTAIIGIKRLFYFPNYIRINKAFYNKVYYISYILDKIGLRRDRDLVLLRGKSKFLIKYFNIKITAIIS